MAERKPCWLLFTDEERRVSGIVRWVDETTAILRHPERWHATCTAGNIALGHKAISEPAEVIPGYIDQLWELNFGIVSDICETGEL